MQANCLVFWTGPVQEANLADVYWSTPTKVVTVNKGICGGADDPSCHKSNAFSALAKALNADGSYETKLDALQARMQVEGEFKRRVISGFSAGYALVEGVLTDKATANQVDVVMGLDCYYFQIAAPGFTAFAKRAAAGEKLMIMTTSGSPDAGFLTPSEGIKALVKELGVENLTEQQIDEIWPKDLQRPQLVQRAGNFLHVAYGTSLFHGKHATVVGPALMQAWASPYLAGLDESTPSEPKEPARETEQSNDVPMPLKLAAAGLAGLASWMVLSRVMRGKGK